MTRMSTLPSTLPSTREQAQHALLLLGVPTPARLLVDVHTALLDGDLSVAALAALLRAEERSAGPDVHGAAPFVAPAPGHAAADVQGAAPFVAPAPRHVAGDVQGAAPFVEPRPGHAPGDVQGAAPLVAPGPGRVAGPEGGVAARDGDQAGWSSGGPGRPYLICPGLNPDLTAARSVITLSVWDVADRICTPAAARAEALAATVRIAELVTMRPGVCATALLRQLAADVPGGPESFDPLNPSALATAARAALEDPALAAAVAAEQPLRDAAVARAATLDDHQRLFGVPSVPQQRGRA